MNTFPLLYRQIKKWLKAGVLCNDLNVYKEVIKKTLEGTPQGGVISPLLANIVLDGIEKKLKTKVTELYGVKSNKSLTVIRYADDIVIVHPDLEVINFCKCQLDKFLLEFNLK